MIARQPEATGTCAMRHVNADLIRDHSLYSRRDTRMYILLSPIRRRSRGERIFFQGTKNLKTARRKNGIVKIEHCCRQAKVYGCQWVWVDTCCIDKVSSAELLEAINLTYWWYLHWMLFSTQPMAPSNSSLPSHLGGCCDSSIEAGHYKSISLF